MRVVDLLLEVRLRLATDILLGVRGAPQIRHDSLVRVLCRWVRRLVERGDL